jgi:hypothetical protein
MKVNTFRIVDGKLERLFRGLYWRRTRLGERVNIT